MQFKSLKGLQLPEKLSWKCNKINCQQLKKMWIKIPTLIIWKEINRFLHTMLKISFLRKNIFLYQYFHWATESSIKRWDKIMVGKGMCKSVVRDNLIKWEKSLKFALIYWIMLYMGRENDLKIITWGFSFLKTWIKISLAFIKVNFKMRVHSF